MQEEEEEGLPGYGSSPPSPVVYGMSLSPYFFKYNDIVFWRVISVGFNPASLNSLRLATPSLANVCQPMVSSWKDHGNCCGSMSTSNDIIAIDKGIPWEGLSLPLPNTHRRAFDVVVPPAPPRPPAPPVASRP